MNKLLAPLVLIACSIGVQAQTQTPATIVPFPLTAANYVAFYSQDFGPVGPPVAPNLAITPDNGTGSTLPPGWGFAEAGTNANTTYGVDDGTQTAGDTYSYGSAAVGPNTDRAFGTLQSGSLIPSIGAVFQNTTTDVLSTLTITYTGEQWRNGDNGATADRLDFQYNPNSAVITGTTGWLDVNALDFSSLINGVAGTALNGNLAANRTTGITATISGLSIQPGQTFAIRWLDFNVGGTDDGLAVDDFVMAIPEPSTWVMGSLLLASLLVSQRRRLRRKPATA